MTKTTRRQPGISIEDLEVGKTVPIQIFCRGQGLHLVLEVKGRRIERRQIASRAKGHAGGKRRATK
jgi:hypothetical protein